MRLLVACEYSGLVRDAFIRGGHEAMSCDLLPTDAPGPHYQGNVVDLLDKPWDMILAFPPCTHLAVSGAKHFAAKRADGRQQEGIDFFNLFTNLDVERVCIENPIGIMSKLYRKPDQIIQPWMFGDEAQKSTCLWLKGLPLLTPTNIVGKGDFYVSPSGKKLPAWYNGASAKTRSKTFQGIANAMAAQWS